MKLVEINGSPRLNGNTKKILDLCKEKLDNLSEDQNEYEIISLSKNNLLFCKGCRTCLDLSEEKCPQKDDFLSIKEKIENADCIIIGSPIYVEDVSGTMKNFLDRMAFNCHRPFLQGKPVYIFTTSASIASKHGLKTLKRAFISWGATIIQSDNFVMGKISSFDSASANFGQTIEKRMTLLLKQYKTCKITFYNLIAFAIQKNYWGKQKDTADYNYWHKMNWLNPKCLYFKDVHLNILKKYTAILINFLLSKI